MPEGLPTWSVIIPTRNRPERLHRCLDALAVQAYPADRYEVIVVDDGSTPPLVPWTVLREGLQVHWLHQANAGPGAARNHGASVATGSWLAFTDDDCEPSPTWLHELALAASAHPGGLIGGATSNALSDNPFAITSQLIVDTALTWLASARRDLQFVPSNNLAMSADAFRAVGGFDAAFRTAEDRELCDRWLREGGTIVRAERAFVAHSHDLTMAGFWRQHFGYGRGARRFHDLRHRRGAAAFRPDGWHALFACRTAWRTVRGPRRLEVLAALGLWQLANLCGFLREALAGASPAREP